MKAFIKFELPEEQEAFDESIDGPKAFSVIRDLDSYLRGKIKYHELTEEQETIYQEVRDTLGELVEDRNISPYC